MLLVVTLLLSRLEVESKTTPAVPSSPASPVRGTAAPVRRVVMSAAVTVARMPAIAASVPAVSVRSGLCEPHRAKGDRDDRNKCHKNALHSYMPFRSDLR